ncbi:MAG: pyridine nucleotide-disulfide oxidoreductase [Balneola sp.]|nr:pyridine nucleotide-disulfide oxidoreductase [Balneola sp.]
MDKTILVLGGGIGGINVAKELNRKIGNEDGINLARILVFERNRKNVFAPSLTWLMVGKREEEQVYRDTKDAEVGGIEFVFGEIDSVNPEQKTVEVDGVKYIGDYMIISLGVEQSSKHHLDEFGQNFYTIDGASAFYDKLEDFEGGNIAITVSSLPYKSPVAPYEAAMLIDNYLYEKGVKERAEITIYTPESKPMPFTGEEISENVLQLLKSKGIKYMPNHQLLEGSENSLSFKTDTEERKEVEFDLLTFTPDHKCPPVIEEAGLTGKSGWVEVDEKSLETKFPNVYAIGDIISIVTEDGESLPKSGVLAQHQGDIVAHNIGRHISGKAANKSFEGEGDYILDMGADKAQKVKGNFYKNDLELKKSGIIRHWEKVLTEKSWFIKNF